MKVIALLIFTFLSMNSYSQVVRCGLLTHEEIDTCTIEDKLPTLLESMYPSHSITTQLLYESEDPCDPETIDNEETPEVEECPVWDQKTGKFYYEAQEYDEDGAPELSFYERLVMLEKPLESAFATELLAWAAEKKILVDWRIRVDSLTRIRRAAIKCGYLHSNMERFKDSLVLNDPKVDCLESKSAELDAEDVQQAAKNKRNKDINFGVGLIEDVLILIPGDMDPVNKLALLDYLAKIERLLRLGDIDGAKALTEATPLTALFSAPLQGFLVGKMTAYLGE